MGVTLTEKAASEVKKIITEQNLPEGTVLRVGVQGGGCSGFSYSLGFDTSTSEKDRVIELHGIKLAVEKKFDPYLEGTVVDYYDGLEKRGLRLQQPERCQVVRLRQLVSGLVRSQLSVGSAEPAWADRDGLRARDQCRNDLSARPKGRRVRRCISSASKSAAWRRSSWTTWPMAGLPMRCAGNIPI